MIGNKSFSISVLKSFLKIAGTGTPTLNLTEMENPECVMEYSVAKRGFAMNGRTMATDKTPKPAFLNLINVRAWPQF